MHLISLSIKRFGCSLFCKKICSIMRTHFLDGLNIIFAATNRILQILNQSKYLCSLPLIRIDSHKILYSWTLPMKFTFNFVVIQENGDWYTLILILHVQFFFRNKIAWLINFAQSNMHRPFDVAHKFFFSQLNQTTFHQEMFVLCKIWDNSCMTECLRFCMINRYAETNKCGRYVHLCKCF